MSFWDVSQTAHPRPASSHYTKRKKGPPLTHQRGKSVAGRLTCVTVVLLEKHLVRKKLLVKEPRQFLRW